MRSAGLRAVAVALALVAAACGRGATETASGASTDAAASAPDPVPGSSAAAVVHRVVDGDTIRAKIGRRAERVRLIGIDTPESVKPNTPVECFAREAAARTNALLPKGSRVQLVIDVEPRDRYKRLLAYVYREIDGAFVNLVLVEEGYAVPYTYPPNVAHAEEFVAASARAREARKGLWSRCRDPSAA